MTDIKTKDSEYVTLGCAETGRVGGLNHTRKTGNRVKMEDGLDFKRHGMRWDADDTQEKHWAL